MRCFTDVYFEFGSPSIDFMLNLRTRTIVWLCHRELLHYKVIAYKTNVIILKSHISGIWLFPEKRISEKLNFSNNLSIILSKSKMATVSNICLKIYPNAVNTKWRCCNDSCACCWNFELKWCCNINWSMYFFCYELFWILISAFCHKIVCRYFQNVCIFYYFNSRTRVLRLIIESINLIYNISIKTKYLILRESMTLQKLKRSIN